MDINFLLNIVLLDYFMEYNINKYYHKHYHFSQMLMHIHHHID